MKNSPILFATCLLVALANVANAQFPPMAPTLPEGTKTYRDLAYVTNGHQHQKLDIYVPKTSKTPPLIVDIHGGAFLFGDKGDMNPTKFLKAGYAVASISYRLGGEAKYPAQIEDCKAAVRWLRANASKYGYDPKNFGAYGESAGGTLVALLGTTGNDKTYDVGENLNVSSAVQAVADFFGPIDFLQMNVVTKPNGETSYAPNTPEEVLVGGPVGENKEKVKKLNPITYLSSKTPPFYIAHGDADSVVPYKQSIILEAALKEAKIPVTLYILKGVNHGFQDATADKQAVEFFNKYLTQ